MRVSTTIAAVALTVALGSLGACAVYEPAPYAGGPQAYAPAPQPYVYEAPPAYYAAPAPYYYGPSVGLYFGGGGRRERWH